MQLSTIFNRRGIPCGCPKKNQMNYNSKIHHRRSIRLKEYDYSKSGSYFITICIQNKICLLGSIVDEKMIKNDAGKMVDTQWNKLKNRFNNIELDEYIIMPNHFHGILIIETPFIDTKNIRADTRSAPTNPTVSSIIGAFKSITTKEYINNVKSDSWPLFHKKLWQKNYYEHIIRNEKSLEEIREYITNNPRSWEQDELFLHS